MRYLSVSYNCRCIYNDRNVFLNEIGATLSYLNATKLNAITIITLKNVILMCARTSMTQDNHAE